MPGRSSAERAASPIGAQNSRGNPRVPSREKARESEPASLRRRQHLVTANGRTRRRSSTLSRRACFDLLCWPASRTGTLARGGIPERYTDRFLAPSEIYTWMSYRILHCPSFCDKTCDITRFCRGLTGEDTSVVFPEIGKVSKSEVPRIFLFIYLAIT